MHTIMQSNLYIIHCPAMKKCFAVVVQYKYLVDLL